jgi:hypothetical protein
MGDACRSLARPRGGSVFFLTARSLRGHKFLFFYRAQLARWKSCFTSAAQQLRGAGF